MSTHLVSRIPFACLLLVACVPEGAERGPQLQGAAQSELTDTSALSLVFEEAGAEWGVPADVLEAIAFVETQLEPIAGEAEFEGQAVSYGRMGLRGVELQLGARLSGLPVEAVMSQEDANVRAAAALLDWYAELEGLSEEARQDPLAWGPAVARYGELDPEVRDSFQAQVLYWLQIGAAVPMEDGTTLVIGRYAEDAEGLIAQTQSAISAANTRWLPSPNYNFRGGATPHFVVIHTCEGSYAGCVSWLRNTAAVASAHYVVREDGGEVAQLVDEVHRAWHVAANYRDHLNGNSHPEYQGVSVNTYSIGIEHGGFASQRSFNQGMIDRSVRLVRDIIQRYDLPADRYHIVAHGKLQPESRTDPGPNWPWTSYLAAIAGDSGSGGSGGSSGTTVTVDNTTAGRFRASSNWNTSSWASGKIGTNYRYREPEAVSDLAEFKVALPSAGRYEVFARVPGNGYNTRTPFYVHHKNGRTSVQLDVSARGASWASLGTFDFDQVDDWIVQVSCWTGGSGYIVADAVRLVKQ